MIQRIQSIYFALITLLIGVMSFTTLVEFVAESVYIMKSYSTFSVANADDIIMNNLGIGIIGGIVMLLSLATIFMFKNRKLQMQLGKLTILLLAIHIVAVFLYVDGVQSKLGEVVVNYQYPVVFPLIGIILAFLAVKAIKKDDDLVRSVDRLR